MTFFSALEEGNAIDELFHHELESIEPELALLRRTAFSGRDRISFEFGNARFRIRFVADHAGITPILGLQIRIGPSRGWLYLESFDVVGEEWAGVFEALDGMLVRALLIEETSRQFEKMALACGEAVRLIDLQVGCEVPAYASLQALRVENETSGVGTRALLAADTPDFFSQLAAVLVTRSPRAKRIPNAARLPLRIAVGSVSLSTREIAQSRPGDILILPVIGTLASLQCICLDHRGKRFPLRAGIEGHNGRLTRYEEGAMMEERMGMKMADEEAGSLDNASIPVTVVIGEIELPVHVLGELEAGYVFELPMDVTQATVRLYTGSRNVGTGRLVAVGERLGVRLLEWGGADDGYLA
jgi:type III secretion system YscQ/HrcQ family protein